jgi:hypothetical protein
MKSRNELLPPGGSSVAPERLAVDRAAPRSMFILPSRDGARDPPQRSIRKGRSAEWHVRFDAGNIGLVDQAGLGHVTFPFRAFCRHQMPAGSMLTHHFARSRDFESFRDRLSRFAARDWFRHKARKITAI